MNDCGSVLKKSDRHLATPLNHVDSWLMVRSRHLQKSNREQDPYSAAETVTDSCFRRDRPPGIPA